MDNNRVWFNTVAKTFVYLFTAITLLYLFLVGFNDLYVPLSYLAPSLTLFKRIGIVIAGIIFLVQLPVVASYYVSVLNKRYVPLAVMTIISWFVFVSGIILIAHID
ncbi:MAG: hypothetical protein COA63_009525 [Methylophaga sp.]|nr:hypothetical protein [Methylophaga sp.]